MADRHWDPRDKYIESLIREYSNWSVEVAVRQHTLGSLVIWAHREIERIADLSAEELLELKEVMKDVEAAISKSPAFKADRFNYLQLGNHTHHLHIHVIPRYKTARTLLGKTWRDNRWGNPPEYIFEESDWIHVREVKRLLLEHWPQS